MPQIKNLLLEGIEDNQSLLVVGASGSQKTLGILHNPPPYFIVASDPGKRSGLDPIWEELKLNKDNFVFRAEPYDGMFRDLEDAIKNAKDKYNTIIPGDSLTYLQQSILTEVMLHGSGRSKPRPTFDEWGTVQDRTRRIIVEAVNTGANIYATCLEQLIKEEITGSVTGLPLMYGRLAYDISGMFRTVVRLFAKPKQKDQPDIIARCAMDHIWRFPKDSKGILSAEEDHPKWIDKMYQAGKK